MTFGRRSQRVREVQVLSQHLQMETQCIASQSPEKLITLPRRWQKCPGSSAFSCDNCMPDKFPFQCRPPISGRNGYSFPKASGKLGKATHLVCQCRASNSMSSPLIGFSTKLHVVFAVNSNCSGVFQGAAANEWFWLAKPTAE